MNNIILPPNLREQLQNRFILLNSVNAAKKRDTIELNLSGYSDVMYLIADIVKVSILALDGDHSYERIPEPVINICGVLGIILDLIPYEEADILDALRQAVLIPSEEEEKAQTSESLVIENYFLTPPSSLIDNEEPN
ncbi:hypothetical protein [Flavobacterium capsici]|uniref:Uncharacterized protein n=1 Tax=Flavobacterium capsici TaxID=3075618 RepID=A0AA96J1Y1_9FLAO|nr:MULTISPECIES: hypothetical protein [unclassified Flavobacterium]WNM18882.1 hypothetical protein RN608_12820 [Flavobacterium sp. PMR2A8]WNM22932.1 hypothetical protein RN605_06120 [Flavobacterium sp. PMTSA4]